jgi:hypothetical protein
MDTMGQKEYSEKQARKQEKALRRAEREKRKECRKLKKISIGEKIDHPKGKDLKTHSKRAENITWLEDCSQLFLDGNNMYSYKIWSKFNVTFTRLFALTHTRHLVLQKKTTEAELLLKNMVKNFAATTKLRHSTLIFDETELPKERSESFSLCCARPTMKTSDDALVAMALVKDPNEKWIVVTSDRELRERLHQSSNVFVWKPNQWFRIADSSATSNSI